MTSLPHFVPLCCNVITLISSDHHDDNNHWWTYTLLGQDYKIFGCLIFQCSDIIDILFTTFLSEKTDIFHQSIRDWTLMTQLNIINCIQTHLSMSFYFFFVLFCEMIYSNVFTSLPMKVYQNKEHINSARKINLLCSIHFLYFLSLLNTGVTCVCSLRQSILSLSVVFSRLSSEEVPSKCEACLL